MDRRARACGDGAPSRYRDAGRPLREHDVREVVRSLAGRIDELAVRPDDGVVTNRLDTIERQRATDAETIDVLLLALDRIREDLSEREPARTEHDGENDGSSMSSIAPSRRFRRSSLRSTNARPTPVSRSGLQGSPLASRRSIPPHLRPSRPTHGSTSSYSCSRSSGTSCRPSRHGHASREQTKHSHARLRASTRSRRPPAGARARSADRRARAFRLRAQGRARVTRRPTARPHRRRRGLALLTARVEEIAATPAPSYEPDPRVDELGDALAELRIRMESLASPPREPADDGILAALTSRVDALTSAPPAVDEERLRGIESLAERLETLSRDLEVGRPSPTRSGARASTRPSPISSNGSGSRSSASAFTWESTIGRSRTHAQSWRRAPRRGSSPSA